MTAPPSSQPPSYEPIQPQDSWAEADEDDGGGVDLARLLTGYLPLLVLTAAIGGGLGYWNFTQIPPEYSAATRLQLVQKIVESPVDGTTQTKADRNLADDHSVVIRSPVVLSRAVEEGNLDELDTLASSSDPVKVISGRLRVSRLPSSDKILDLTYRCGSPDDCKTVLDAVVAAYVKFVSDSQKSENIHQLEKLREEETRKSNEIESIEQEYEKFLATSPLIVTAEGVRNIHKERLAVIEEQRREYRMEEKMLQAELDAIEEAMDAGEDGRMNTDAILLMALKQLPMPEEIKRESPEIEPVELPEIPEVPAEIPLPIPETAIDTTQSDLLPLLVKEQTMRKARGARHPDLLALQEEIALKREILAQQQQEKQRQMRERNALLLQRAEQLAAIERAKQAREDAIREAERVAREAERRQLEGDDVELTRPDLLQTYLQSLRTRLDVARRKSVMLDEEYDREEEAGRIVSFDENRDRELRDRRQRANAYFDAYSEKLQALEFLLDEPFLRVVPLEFPSRGVQVAPKLTDNVLFGSVLGLLMGLGLAFLWERSHRTFRSPEEISRTLGMPVIAHIPPLTKLKRRDGSMIDKSIVAFHKPHSRLSESYRSIRTPLLFQSERHGLRVLQVTSPNPSDGKSTLTANLAVTLARSGKRVLLVDADFRRPKVGKLFDLENVTGFADVIVGEATLKEAIQTLEEVPGLDVLTTGSDPGNVTELVLSERFSTAMRRFREHYDFVLVDSPPVLAVTDASALAAKVDAVLLVLRITKRTRAEASRAMKTLQMVGARFVGAVVNHKGGKGEKMRAKFASYSNYDYSGYSGYGGYNSRNYHDESTQPAGGTDEPTRTAAGVHVDIDGDSAITVERRSEEPLTTAK